MISVDFKISTKLQRPRQYSMTSGFTSALVGPTI